MATVELPGVGFGQVVRAGIDLVDGKKPGASSTCVKTESLMNIYHYILHY